MGPRRAWLWLVPSLCSCLDVSTMKKTSPYFIITCNESRTPDEMVFLLEQPHPAAQIVDSFSVGEIHGTKRLFVTAGRSRQEL